MFNVVYEKSYVNKEVKSVVDLYKKGVIKKSEASVLVKYLYSNYIDGFIKTKTIRYLRKI